MAARTDPPRGTIIISLCPPGRCKWIGASFAEITDLMELARRSRHTFWGLPTRTAATIAAHAPLRARLADLARA